MIITKLPLWIYQLIIFSIDPLIVEFVQMNVSLK